MRKFLLGVAALATAATATPAFAQQSSYKLGPLWTAARIDVADGQYENYMDWLMKVWAKSHAVVARLLPSGVLIVPVRTDGP